MAAGLFSTLGVLLLIAGPVAALFFSSVIGTLIAAIVAASAIGSAVSLFAIAVVIDRLNKLVAASKH
ncbi:hypothetical protein GOL49_14765 [Sinorhizobium medicae]|nr:hypothetical protein [Sinorhizobium meliloti]MDX1082262.1 hypothetical protein [Sinorhizobium medicae]